MAQQVAAFGRAEERPRSMSMGESSRSIMRPFAIPADRQMSSNGGASLNAEPSVVNTGMQRQNSLSATMTGGSNHGSGRASPALSHVSRRSLRTNSQRGSGRIPPTLSSNVSGASSGHGLPTLKNLESYSSRNVAAALEPGADPRQVDDVWQAVCVRVLPLFNGEGIRGFVEDLNELVCTHVQRTFVRCQTSGQRPSRNPSADLATLVTGLLIADLSELLRIGTLTLSGKFSSPQVDQLSDDRFLARLNEVWLFFWGSVLPNLEGVFWLLRCDERLKAAVGGTQREREREGRTKWGDGRIDVRKLALIEFRDHLVHPQVERLSRVLLSMNSSGAPSDRAESPAQQDASHHDYKATTSSIATAAPPSGRRGSGTHWAPTAATIQAAARRRQMIAVLASVLTGDERQAEMDGLLHTMRHSSFQTGTHNTTPDGRRPPYVAAHSSQWESQDRTTPGGGRGPTQQTRRASDRGAGVSDEAANGANGNEGNDGSGADEALKAALSGRRLRAHTMDSLDEEGGGGDVSVSSFDPREDGSPVPANRDETPATVTLDGGAHGSATPIPRRRHSGRSFLARIGRTHSGGSGKEAMTAGGGAVQRSSSLRQ